MEFPRWMYRADVISGRLFYTAKELEAAGEGWYDSPAFLHQGEEDATGSSQELPKPKRGRPRKVVECATSQH